MAGLTFEELERQVEQQESVASVEQTRFKDWLAECDRVANLWEGPFDSAADLRRLRDEE